MLGQPARVVGPRLPMPGRGIRRRSRHESTVTALGPASVVTLAALTVLAQVAYPLTSGERLRLLTIGTVVLFAATCVVHAWLSRGPGWALALVVVAAGGGLVVEGVGLRTGRPFGHYAYADTLGPVLWRVPLVVPLAWLMMAYPCLLLARTLAERLAVASQRGRRGSPARRGRRPAGATVRVALLGGFAMAAWDVFVDPQMVAAGHWTWQSPAPSLPGTTGVPVTNVAGWFLAGVVLMALLNLVLPWQRRARSTGRRGLSDTVPALLLAWTWLGSTLANALFFDRPAVAAWGGAALGVVVLPYLLVRWGRRP